MPHEQSGGGAALQPQPAFGDTPKTRPGPAQTFRYEEYAAGVQALAQQYNVPADRPTKGGFGGLVQKVMRRLVRFYVHPVVADQNAVNARVLHSLEELQGLAAGYDTLAAMTVGLDAEVHKNIAKPLDAVLENNRRILEENAALRAELEALRTEVKLLQNGERA